MPRQNRVTPFGTLIATPERGTLTGNRGCLHDDRGRIRRDFVGTRWIICLLAFKGRARALMHPGRWTELFFLDEATALAAGHRPCAECQRARFDGLRDAWAGGTRPRAPAIDAALHRERMTPVAERPPWYGLDALPDGAFVADDTLTPYLVLGARPFRWHPGGYDPAPATALRFPVRLLTPASVVRALAAGYQAALHPTAHAGTPIPYSLFPIPR